MINKVNTLADLGKLVKNGADGNASAPDHAPIRKRTPQDILHQYLKRIETDHEVEHADQLANAINDAFDLGKRQAKADHDAAIAVISQIVDQQLAQTMPAAVAGILEQCSMTELVINLDELATVFNRCTIDYHMKKIDGRNCIHYVLQRLPDSVKG